MIKIWFKNGEVVRWKRKSFTDYKYDGRCFIVIRKKQWVGIYNMDAVATIEVREVTK